MEEAEKLKRKEERMRQQEENLRQRENQNNQKEEELKEKENQNKDPVSFKIALICRGLFRLVQICQWQLNCRKVCLPH